MVFMQIAAADMEPIISAHFGSGWVEMVDNLLIEGVSEDDASNFKMLLENKVLSQIWRIRCHRLPVDAYSLTTWGISRQSAARCVMAALKAGLVTLHPWLPGAVVVYPVVGLKG